ncbi:ABC transporter substrate-binding protein [Dictyobacter arantiisoli]|uniref:ABC transporter substrate-binding protein n=1 Tax=Dictyobacter arantiisoli TaxID=2014874 RepID=A0A5A5T8S7_9CHLR|nr:ABC transporter substrate-binding protein [Dictyobacter arantiisoli]GCF07443.1 ABC transporter substrate-binding protein [Dictyobacter arantiisoli]
MLKVRASKIRGRISYLLCIVALLCSACGGSTSDNSASTLPTPAATVAAPTHLVSSGTLTVGTDPSYIPMEYVNTATNHFNGFDIDLATTLAQHMGLKVNIQRTGFDTLLDDLANKRFDIVLAAVTIDDARKAKFDFVPYFRAGESLLVPKGNPLNLKSTADLCGRRVGVQTGTVENQSLNTASVTCQQNGKPAIIQTVLQSQTDVIQLLVNRRVDATFQDSPVTDYYNKINPGQFEIGGSITNSVPYGIVIRKGDSNTLQAVQNAFQVIKRDGIYDKLFTKWGFSSQQKIS